MAYLILLVGVLSWAGISLYRQPLVQYAQIFFACTLAAVPAELATYRLLHVYEWRMQLLTDREADQMVASLIIAVLNPLFGVLYARYCRSWPVLKALIGSLLLALTEVLLLKTGYMVYHFWTPLLTACLFFGYFLSVRKLTLMGNIPPRVHVLGFVLWVNLLVDIPLQGIWWLWHFNIKLFGEPVRDNRLFSVVPMALLLCPCATAVAMARGRKYLWMLIGVSFLVLTEAGELAIGLLVHDRWSLAWSAVKYSGIITAAILYRHWVQRSA